MTINANDLTREQIREILARQRAGYEQMENDRLRQEWREPTIEEKLEFDAFLDDVLRVPKPYVEHGTGLVEWYRLLMRKNP